MNYGQEFKTGSFSTVKIKINKYRRIIKIKWFNTRDALIWFGLVVIVLFFMIYVRVPRSSYDSIYLNKDVDTIKELLDLSDDEVRKLDKKAKLVSVSGYIEGASNIDRKKPRIRLEYATFNKGLGKTVEHSINFNADFIEQEISSIYRYRYDYSYDYKDKFVYNIDNFDLDNIYSIIYKNIDMTAVLNGYKPTINFYLSGYRCDIDVSYYKNKEDEQQNFDSAVRYRVEYNIRTQEIKNIRKTE